MPSRSSPPRLIDIADAAGVSIATASRVMAGASGVSPAMVERVRRIADELGYVANAHARGLARGASASVALLVHDIGDPYFTEIASGVIELATERGLMVQVCHSGRDPAVERSQIRAATANHTGAIIIAGSGYTEGEVEADVRGELARFVEGGGRVAVIGRHGLGADAVLPANRAGGRDLADHLVSLGHRVIGVASGPATLTTVADRMDGVDEILTKTPDVSCLRVESSFDREGGMAAARQILGSQPGTTAILALNDAMAIGVLAVLRDSGIACPSQVSVTGFDDVAVAADLAPSLTTVRLPMHDFGRLALEMALGQAARRPRRKRTGHSLVVRESTAAPRTD